MNKEELEEKMELFIDILAKDKKISRSKLYKTWQTVYGLQMIRTVIRRKKKKEVIVLYPKCKYHFTRGARKGEQCNKEIKPSGDEPLQGLSLEYCKAHLNGAQKKLQKTEEHMSQMNCIIAASRHYITANDSRIGREIYRSNYIRR